MAVTYIENSSDVSHAVYGMPDPRMIQMANEGLQRMQQHEFLASSGVLDYAAHIHTAYHSDQAVQRALEITSETGRAGANTIAYYGERTYKNITPIMQEFVMSHPTIRYAYKYGEIAGYEGVNTDSIQHLYGNVYSGYVDPYVEHGEYVDGSEVELKTYEKHTIMDTYAAMIEMLEDDIDFTDIEKGDA